MTDWHNQSTDEALAALHSHGGGLGAAEVERRLAMVYVPFRAAFFGTRPPTTAGLALSLSRWRRPCSPP